MSFTQAIARIPGIDFAEGITASGLGKPNYELMLEQHAAYLDVLRSLGLRVDILDPLLGYPDAHFVEDTAVVTSRVAVIANPGAPARQGEEESIAEQLSRYRTLERILPPGTLDGGDVLMVADHFFVGISERTNQAGADQFGRILEAYGYTWTPAPVAAGLHLKSSVNTIGKETLLATRDFARRDEFKSFNIIPLTQEEAYAANTLLVNDCLLMPSGFPSVKDKLKPVGFEIIELDVSEVRKMDGGLTCMSLRF